MGELTGPLVRSWLTSATAPQDNGPWTVFRARQYLSWGGEGPSDHAGAVGRITGLAMLADSVEQNSLNLDFRNMIRTRNAALLNRILEGRPLFQECTGPTLSCDADLEALDRAGSLIFRSRVSGLPPGPKPLKKKAPEEADGFTYHSEKSCQSALPPPKYSSGSGPQQARILAEKAYFSSSIVQLYQFSSFMRDSR